VKLPVFSVDTTAPDTTLTSGPANVTSSTSATFTFTSSTPDSTFQCSLDGQTQTPCSSPETYTGLADGAHTFTVAAVDPAGNVDPTPASSSWTVDTTAPTVTLTSPVAASYTNNTTPTFRGAAEVATGDSGVTVTIYSGAGTGGTVVQTLTAPVQPGGTWTVNAGSLPQGTYTAEARQTDAASNTGYSSQDVFTVDTTPPTVTLYTPADGTHTNDTMPEISGVAGTAVQDAPSVTVTVTGGASPVQLTANVSPSGAWDVNLPESLADGNYAVQAAQQDLAGNTGYSYSDFTIDTTPPQTFLDSGPVGTTSSTTATFTFHSTDALSQAGSTFQCQLDGGIWTTCSSPQSYSGLADGTHTFSVEAVDGAGNVDYTGATDTWTINSTLPPVTLDAPAENAFTNDTTPTFSGSAGTATGDSVVRVLIYAGTDLSGSPVQTLDAVVASDGTWSATATTLANGTYVAYAQQSNGAGTATSDTHTFTVNTQAPTTTITVGPPGNSGTGAASFSFVSSEAGSTFQCQLDGGAWTPCVSPQDYSGLGDGSHTFEVRATDPAGNVGAPASQTWSVNTSLPALSLSAPSDGAFSNDPQLSISGTGGTAAGDAASVTVELYGGTSIAGTPLETIVTSVSSGTGSWSTRPNPALADGTYTVYAEQTGSAGTAYTAAHTFTVDTVPPTTTIVSGPQGTTAATSARFVFNSSAENSTFQCQLDGGPCSPCTSPQSYSALATGMHTFSVRATDPAGNTDPDPPEQVWTIDPTVPVTLTSPADGISTNNNALTFSGAANAANGPITVEIDDTDGNPVEFLTASAGTSWSVGASPALPDGAYTAFASQLASDGVTTDYSNVIDFTVDTTPPAVTLTTSPSGTIGDRTPSFGGAAGVALGDLGTVKLEVFSGSSATGTPVQTVSVTPTGGAWSAAPSSLADGTYTVRAEQSDAAGNTGYTVSDTFTVDATPPTTTIIGGPPSSTTATTASFGFTSSQTGSTFACRLDGGAWTPCTSPVSYSSLGAGPHTFSVRATDAVGNVDPTPPSRSWTVTGSAAGGGGTPGGTGGAPGGAPGTVPPGSLPAPVVLHFTLTAKAKQHLGSRRTSKLVVTARCSTACSVTLGGKFSIAAVHTLGRRVKARTARVARLLVSNVSAGKSIKLTIKLSKTMRRLIAAALAQHRRVTVTLTGLASAHGARAVTAVVTIRLVV
jgi:large repetitive protein